MPSIRHNVPSLRDVPKADFLLLAFDVLLPRTELFDEWLGKGKVFENEIGRFL